MRRLFTLIAILLIAFTVRAHLLGQQELRGDEGFSWNYVQDSPLEIVARIVREGDPQPPIHYWVLWGWVKLTGDSEFAMRALSAFLSLLLAPLMYQTGRKLWRSEVGLLAAALTAIHPQQVWLAQDVRSMYLLALIALLIGTLLLHNLLGGKPRRAANWVGYVACGAFAMYSHYYALFPLIAHGGLAAEKLWPRRKAAPFRSYLRAIAIPWAAGGIAVAALVAPWAAIILPVYARGQLADPGSMTFVQYAAAVFGDLAAGPDFPAATKVIIAAAFALLAVFALVNRRVPRRFYLLASILVPFFGIYAIVALRSTFNTFYFVVAFPAAYLLASGGALFLYRRAPPLGAGLIAVAVIIAASGLDNHYFDPEYSKTRGLREVAARLAESARPGDVYLANFPDPAQVYYLRNLKLNYHMLPSSPDFDPAAVDSDIARLLDARVWFVPVSAAQWDANGYVERRLLDTALLAEDDQLNKMRLMLFLPASAAQPLAAHFADGISLIGYYLTSNRLTLVWRADAKPTADYTVFVHALAADGYNLSSHDTPPVRPTSSWRPGDAVLSIHPFEIPTDRPISLVAGLYLPSTGQRAPILSPPFGEPDAALVLDRWRQP